MSKVLILVIKCDECGKQLEQVMPGIDKKEPLMAPWRSFILPGWIGYMDSCTDACEAAIRLRNGK